MKIVWTDNFNREYISERVVAEGLSREEAEKQLAELRATCSESGPDWYRMIEDHEQPYRYEP